MDAPLKNLGVRIPLDLAIKLKVQAAKQQVCVQDIVIVALRNQLSATRQEDANHAG